MLAPADDYVAEFVRHMNPLDVLTGGMIMCQRSQMPSDGGIVWLDERRRYRLSLSPAEEALGVQLDGVEHALRYVRDEAALKSMEPGPGVAVAPTSLSLQAIIRLRQATGHPVLLAEGGKIIGVCGEAEIIRALAGGRH